MTMRTKLTVTIEIDNKVLDSLKKKKKSKDGTEKEKGIKDHLLISRFVKEVGCA